jgi:o-succinylbenzoate synthase
MIKANLITHHLKFKIPAGTSRGVLNEKPTWYLVLKHELTQNIGIGECSIIPGLSIDNPETIESILQSLVKRLNSNEVPTLEEYKDFPAVQFALETALEDLAYADNFSPFPGGFMDGKKSIPINGLVWMGDEQFMHQQIQDKINAGFDCIKMKIGAIDFQTELDLLQSIRNKFTANQIELRVDANGAFSPNEAMQKLEALSKFDLHSIEQPIKQDQWKDMAVLCANSPIPIALDEELIGTWDDAYQMQMLDFIRPQYIILKPSLIGGIQASNKWISLAQKSNIGWWATSALESNVGLNAIAQWVSNIDTEMPQGLGTGQLFTNNIDSPLTIKNGSLHHDLQKSWDNHSFE